MSTSSRKTMHLSPIGSARFAYLSEPDDYEGRKRYRTQLLLLEADAETITFKELLTKLVDEAHAANVEAQTTVKAKKAAAEFRKRYPFEDDVDAEGNPTGKVVFKFSQNANIRLKDGTEKHVRPLLVDADRKPIDPEAVKIFTGSTIRVAFTTRPYANAAAEAVGLSLDLAKVQLLKLSKRSNVYEDNTFGKVEGGYRQESIEDDAAAPDSDIPF